MRQHERAVPRVCRGRARCGERGDVHTRRVQRQEPSPRCQQLKRDKVRPQRNVALERGLGCRCDAGHKRPAGLMRHLRAARRRHAARQNRTHAAIRQAGEVLAPARGNAHALQTADHLVAIDSAASGRRGPCCVLVHRRTGHGILSDLLAKNHLPVEQQRVVTVTLPHGHARAHQPG